MFLLSLLSAMPIIGGIFLLMGGHTVLGVTLTVVGVLLLGLVSLASSALSSILLAALYMYAVEGQAPQQFDESLLSRAFAKQ